MLDLEVPYPQHFPAGGSERFILRYVPGEVAFDLFVPVAAPAARLPFTRMPMPEGAVDEHGELPARERDVYATPGAARVAAPAAHADPPERAPQQQLWLGIRGSNRRHDPATTLARCGRGAKRV